MSRTTAMRGQLHRDRQYAPAKLREANAEVINRITQIPESVKSPEQVKSVAVEFAPIITEALGKALQLSAVLIALDGASRGAEYIASDGTPCRPGVPGLVAAGPDIRLYLNAIQEDLKAAFLAKDIPLLPRLPVTVPTMPFPAELVLAMQAHNDARQRQKELEAYASDLARQYREAGAGTMSMTAAQEAEAAAVVARQKRLEAKAELDEPWQQFHKEMSAAIGVVFAGFAGEVLDARANAIVADDMIQALHRAGMRHGLLWSVATWGGPAALTASRSLVETFMRSRSPRRDQMANQIGYGELLRAQTAEAEAARQAVIDQRHRDEIAQFNREHPSERQRLAARGDWIEIRRRDDLGEDD